MSRLPVEILLLIVQAILPRKADLNSLAKGSKYLHKQLNPFLYKHNIENENGTAVFWAAEHGRVDTLELLKEHGAEFNDSSGSREVACRHLHPRNRCGFPKECLFFPLHVAAKFGQDLAVAWLMCVHPLGAAQKDTRARFQ